MVYRILVAEDDKSLNQGIRLALQKEGVIFDAAYTLEETWKLWQEKKPDMFLLDVNFPDGNGFDFLRRLCGSSDIPVLMITANDMESDEVTGYLIIYNIFQISVIRDIRYYGLLKTIGTTGRQNPYGGQWPGQHAGGELGDS